MSAHFLSRASALVTAVALATTMSVAVTGIAPEAAAATSPYLQPVDRITPAKGCAPLRAGYNGTKVKVVQRALGMGASKWETMDAATLTRVKSFQKSKGLRQTGVVDATTWRALGTSYDYCMDGYQVPVALPLSASAAQRTETTVQFALTYVGGEYVWGGAGTKKQGVDCSGLVLQSLYRAGLDPQPVTVDKHILPTYRTAAELYALPGLRHHPLSQRKRGDLIFYRNDRTGRVNHVAIWLGNGQLVEALPSTGIRTATFTSKRSTQTVMPEVVRPFA